MKVYVIVNRVNQKMYVGQTIGSLHDRWKQHQRSSHCRALANAIKKYGADTFTIRELASANSLEELNRLERQLIGDLNTLAPNGYNLRSGGDNGLHSDESRLRMSRVQREVFLKVWGNGRYPHSGHRHSLESRRRISVSHTGRTQNEASVARRAKKLRKPILCKTTGRSFESVVHAALELDIPVPTVSRLARSGKRSRQGFEFCFI